MNSSRTGMMFPRKLPQLAFLLALFASFQTAFTLSAQQIEADSIRKYLEAGGALDIVNNPPLVVETEAQAKLTAIDDNFQVYLKKKNFDFEKFNADTFNQHILDYWQTINIPPRLIACHALYKLALPWTTAKQHYQVIKQTGAADATPKALLLLNPTLTNKTEFLEWFAILKEGYQETAIPEEKAGFIGLFGIRGFMFLTPDNLNPCAPMFAEAEKWLQDVAASNKNVLMIPQIHICQALAAFSTEHYEQAISFAKEGPLRSILPIMLVGRGGKYELALTAISAAKAEGHLSPDEKEILDRFEKLFTNVVNDRKKTKSSPGETNQINK